MSRTRKRPVVVGNLNGKVSFSDEGGNLKLVVSDTAGQGFTFTSSNTGTVVTGLEPGGTVGGHSAAEIAVALNAQVALNQTLVDAGVSFTAQGGEVRVEGTQKLTSRQPTRPVHRLVSGLGRNPNRRGIR